MANRKKENPPQDLQAHYRSELALLDRRKDQRRQQQADKRKIQSIPEMASYLKDQKHLSFVLKLPRPVRPIGGHRSSSSFTVNLGNRALPQWSKPSPTVGKGLRAIAKIEKKQEETEVLIAQSIEKMAQMEVEAISRGVELPPRETPGDKAGDRKVVGSGKAAKSPPEQAFLSDFQRTLTEGQKAIERSTRARQEIDEPLKGSSPLDKFSADIKKASADQKADTKRLQERLDARQDEGDRQQREIRELKVDLLKQQVRDGKREVNPKGSQRKAKRVKQFPSPPDLRWGEVSMSFLSNEIIQVRARQHIREFRFDKIGFQDGRTGKPNQLWVTLRAFALKGGSLSWDDLSRGSQGGVDSVIVKRIKSDIKRLRKILNAFMGLSEDPFHSYKKKKAYATKFALHADPAKLLDDQKVPSPGETSQIFYDQETSDLKDLKSTHEEASEDDEDWQQSAYEDSMNRVR